MFSKDIAENFICIFTFCDNRPPLIINALTFAGDPNAKPIKPPSVFASTQK